MTSKTNAQLKQIPQAYLLEGCFEVISVKKHNRVFSNRTNHKSLGQVEVRPSPLTRTENKTTKISDNIHFKVHDSRPPLVTSKKSSKLPHAGMLPGRTHSSRHRDPQLTTKRAYSQGQNHPSIVSFHSLKTPKSSSPSQNPTRLQEVFTPPGNSPRVSQTSLASMSHITDPPALRKAPSPGKQTQRHSCLTSISSSISSYSSGYPDIPPPTKYSYSKSLNLTPISSSTSSYSSEYLDIPPPIKYSHSKSLNYLPTVSVNFLQTSISTPSQSPQTPLQELLTTPEKFPKVAQISPDSMPQIPDLLAAREIPIITPIFSNRIPQVSDPLASKEVSSLRTQPSKASHLRPISASKAYRMEQVRKFKLSYPNQTLFHLSYFTGSSRRQSAPLVNRTVSTKSRTRESAFFFKQ